MFCVNCGAQLSDGAKFCSHCGVKQESSIVKTTTNESAKLVPAKCTSCGGQLTVNPSQQAAVCPFCNSAFIVEQAINNYNIPSRKFVTKITFGFLLWSYIKIFLDLRKLSNYHLQ